MSETLEIVASGALLSALAALPVVLAARMLAPDTVNRFLLRRLAPSPLRRLLIRRAEIRLATCDEALGALTSAREAGRVELSDETYRMLLSFREETGRRAQDHPVESARSAGRLRETAIMLLPEAAWHAHRGAPRSPEDAETAYLMVVGRRRRRMVEGAARTLGLEIRRRRLRELPELRESLRAARRVVGLPWIPWVSDRREALVGPLPDVVALEGFYQRIWGRGSPRGKGAYLLYDDPALHDEVERLRRERDGKGR